VAAVEVDGEAFQRFQKDLRDMNREVAKELNKKLRGVLREKVLPAAQANASWSSRIPKAIKPQVTQKVIALRVARGVAPHARPFEGLQTGMRGRKVFRHPVFGNREVWVSQPTRPFLAPAFLDNHDEAVKAASDAISEAAGQVGFK
jgi:hypothetical protein